MNRSVTTVIDPEKCNGCGLCVAVCPKDTISMQNGRARVTGVESLNCGHCAAVCPQGAVRVEALDSGLSAYATFTSDESWLPFGAFDTGRLVQLMRSRRSCRNFRHKPVERAVLEDLIKIGITAPSGSNCQLWSFTILPDRETVLQLGKRISLFLKRINHWAAKAWLRHLLKFAGKPIFAEYYRDHYDSVVTAFERWEKQGEDLLFHGAPAVIIVSSRDDASCPAEDALLATQNILLAAHCMGFGTCLIGYAVSVMQHAEKICRWAGLPQNETPYAVVAVGYPAESYTTLAGRHRLKLRYVSQNGMR